MLKALSQPQWKAAMEEEMRELVGCKCVFIVKNKVYGNVEKYKVRLVAKGHC